MRFLDTLSGKAVENKIETYSEVYGEVLLGIHRDLEKQRHLIHDGKQQLENQAEQFRAHLHALDEQQKALGAQQSDLSEVKQTVAEQSGRFATLTKEIQQLRILCMLSYIFALGLGAVIWLLR